MSQGIFFFSRILAKVFSKEVFFFSKLFFPNVFFYHFIAKVFFYKGCFWFFKSSFFFFLKIFFISKWFVWGLFSFSKLDFFHEGFVFFFEKGCCFQKRKEDFLSKGFFSPGVVSFLKACFADFFSKVCFSKVFFFEEFLFLWFFQLVLTKSFFVFQFVARFFFGGGFVLKVFCFFFRICFSNVFSFSSKASFVLERKFSNGSHLTKWF